MSRENLSPQQAHTLPSIHPKTAGRLNSSFKDKKMQIKKRAAKRRP